MSKQARLPQARAGYRWVYREGCSCKACPWKGNCVGEEAEHWVQVREDEDGGLDELRRRG